MEKAALALKTVGRLLMIRKMFIWISTSSACCCSFFGFILIQGPAYILTFFRIETFFNNAVGIVVAFKHVIKYRR